MTDTNEEQFPTIVVPIPNERYATILQATINSYDPDRFEVWIDDSDGSVVIVDGDKVVLAMHPGNEMFTTVSAEMYWAEDGPDGWRELDLDLLAQQVAGWFLDLSTESDKDAERLMALDRQVQESLALLHQYDGRYKEIQMELSIERAENKRMYRDFKELRRRHRKARKIINKLTRLD